MKSSILEAVRKNQVKEHDFYSVFLSPFSMFVAVSLSVFFSSFVFPHTLLSFLIQFLSSLHHLTR